MLAEAHPDCLMLNFTVKLISDAGYQGEITSVSTACQQLEVFSRVLRTSLATILDGEKKTLRKISLSLQRWYAMASTRTCLHRP